MRSMGALPWPTRPRTPPFATRLTSAGKRRACLANLRAPGAGAAAQFFKTRCGRERNNAADMRAPVSFLAVALAALILETPAFGQDGADTAAQQHRDASTLVAATDHFEFHSDPWINLHHFLYQWARADLGLNRGRRHVPVPERSSVGEMSEDLRAGWLESVRFYRDSIAATSYWDSGMLELKDELLKLGGNPQSRPRDIIDGVSAALVRAMPVYQRTWWPQHDKDNRAWIESVLPRLRAHEKQYVDMTVRVHGAAWPAEPWRVDVSAYANFGAGYTTYEGHIVIYSTDERNQDLYALETLFHEIQHAGAIRGQTFDAIPHIFKARGAEPPDNLWHALIFATAGEFVRSVAASEGRPQHIPYWIREGFENFGGWGNLIPAVNQYWLPVVRGEASREEALAALADALQP